MPKHVSSQKTQERTQRNQTKLFVTPTPVNTRQVTARSEPQESLFSDMLIRNLTIETSHNASFDLQQAKKLLESADKELKNLEEPSKAKARVSPHTTEGLLRHLRQQFPSLDPPKPKKKSAGTQRSKPTPQPDLPASKILPKRSATQDPSEKAGSISTAADSILAAAKKRPVSQAMSSGKAEVKKQKDKLFAQKATDLRKKIERSGFVKKMQRCLTFDLTVQEFPAGPFMIYSRAGEARRVRPRVRPLMAWLNERILESSDQGVWVAVAQVHEPQAGLLLPTKR